MCYFNYGMLLLIILMVYFITNYTEGNKVSNIVSTCWVTHCILLLILLQVYHSLY